VTNTVLTPAPHLRSSSTIETAMYSVILALLPATAVGIYYFGLNAVRVIVLCVVLCVAFEALALRLRGSGMEALKDGSAVLTGLLLAMNLPSNSPSWMILVGCIVAILLTKHVYGGLGFNSFNPALVARVFLLISFPVAMTSWPEPKPFTISLDAVTKATPLGEMKMNLLLQGNNIRPGAAVGRDFPDCQRSDHLAHSRFLYRHRFRHDGNLLAPGPDEVRFSDIPHGHGRADARCHLYGHRLCHKPGNC